MVGWWVEPDRKEKRGNASKGRKARVGMMLAGMAWGGGGGGGLAGWLAVSTMMSIIIGLCYDCSLIQFKRCF